MSQIGQLGIRGRKEAGAVMPRHDPKMKRGAGGVGGECTKAIRLDDHAFADPKLFFHHVTEQASARPLEVTPREREPVADLLGHHRKANHLGMRVDERRARKGPVVLEVNDVLNPRICGVCSPTGDER